MDTDDDALFGGGGPDIPSVKAKQAVKTAKPLEQLSEQAKRNKRLAASFLTQGFQEPRLSQPGMLGF